jgi:hypothetical protein
MDKILRVHYSHATRRNTLDGLFFAANIRGPFAQSTNHIASPGGSGTLQPRPVVKAILDKTGCTRMHTPPNGYCGYIALARLLAVPVWYIFDLLIYLASRPRDELLPTWAAAFHSPESKKTHNANVWSATLQRALLVRQYQESHDQVLDYLPVALGHGSVDSVQADAVVGGAINDVLNFKSAWCELTDFRIICRHVGISVLYVDERPNATAHERIGAQYVELINKGGRADLFFKHDAPQLLELKAEEDFDAVVIHEHMHFTLAVPSVQHRTPAARREAGM